MVKKILIILIFFWIPDLVYGWVKVENGLEYGTFATKKQSPLGDSIITILRIDPRQMELVAIGKSWPGENKSYSVREWAEKHDFIVAINAGMYGTDLTTHIGYLESGGHINNGHVNLYRSVAAFSPKSENTGVLFRIFDLDDPKISMEKIKKDYGSVVQNLRLIKRSAENRWLEQDRLWSEAALAEDTQGNILFIFSESPFSMADFNSELLALDIGVEVAQHLEGGQEAQLFVNTGSLQLNLTGIDITNFWEKREDRSPFVVPNVLGIRRR